MSLDYIIQQVIDTILTKPEGHNTGNSRNSRAGPFVSDKRLPILCNYDMVDSVRMSIHSMLRMAACSAAYNHVVSPCYPSNYAIECRHHDCPYVIGHSIYLWVAIIRGIMHRGEDGGFGCTYKHEKMTATHEEVDAGSTQKPPVRKHATDLNRRAIDIRFRVFDYLDRTYADVSIFRLSPAIAMDRVREYYERIIRPRVNSGILPTQLITALDLTSSTIGKVQIYKSDDGIFGPPPTAKIEEEDEEESQPEDLDIFPRLPVSDKKTHGTSLYGREREFF